MARPTTAFDRSLLFVAIVSFPFLDDVRLPMALSAMWVLFAAIGGYLGLFHLRTLISTLASRIGLSLLAFPIIVSIVELCHPEMSLSIPVRVLQLSLGIGLIASLCRDEAACRTAVLAYVCMGFLLAATALTSYGMLRSATVDNADQLGELRQKASSGLVVSHGLNRKAFLIAEGAILATTLALYSEASNRRIALLGIAVLLLIGCSLLLSRGALLIAVITIAAIALMRRGQAMGNLFILFSIGFIFWIFLPNVVIDRFEQTEVIGEPDKVETRFRLYEAAVSSLPEYGAIGIGAGNFWSDWGPQHGFSASIHGSGGIGIGAHNSFFQVAIYWGLPGLLAFLVCIWHIGRAVRRAHRRNPQDLILAVTTALALSLVLRLLVIHDFYAKEFSLGLGVVLGAVLWVLPPKERRTRVVIPPRPFGYRGRAPV